MRASLRADLTVALRAGDRVAVAALRSALAAVENAEALPVGRGAPVGGEHVAGAVLGVGATEAERRRLTDDELCAIVEGEVRERTVAAQEYERVGRGELAERLRAEAEVLSRYAEGERTR